MLINPRLLELRTLKSTCVYRISKPNSHGIRKTRGGPWQPGLMHNSIRRKKRAFTLFYQRPVNIIDQIELWNTRQVTHLPHVRYFTSGRLVIAHGKKWPTVFNDSSEKTLARGKGNCNSFRTASVGFEPVSPRLSVARSNHWATAPHWTIRPNRENDIIQIDLPDGSTLPLVHMYMWAMLGNCSPTCVHPWS